MNVPPIVSPQEWDSARQEILVREKEHTRTRDAPAAARRRMPRMAVEKDYRFDGPPRDTTLAFALRAPQPDIERWKARMGWEIPWYIITADFDADSGVDEWHCTNGRRTSDNDRRLAAQFGAERLARRKEGVARCLNHES